MNAVCIPKNPHGKIMIRTKLSDISDLVGIFYAHQGITPILPPHTLYITVELHNYIILMLDLNT